MTYRWGDFHISEERDFLVIYVITGGLWVGSGASRKFISSSEIGNTKTLVVKAMDYQKARAIAKKQLEKTRAINEFVKIIRAVPIPKKKEELQPKEAI